MFEPRTHRVVDEESGLLAFVVIDDSSLGPAAGGIRTRRYGSEDEAVADAAALARAMTYKCALAGIPAGGGKGVVMLRDDMDREQAFERLGGFVEGLGGRFVTAGDMGTTAADLRAMARQTAHVYIDEAGLSEAVGRGCVRAMEACVDVLEGAPASLSGRRIALQGCGTVGAAVALEACRRGAEILVADLDDAAAERLARELPAADGHAPVVVDADEILFEEVDILSPCAIGGVIDGNVALGLRASAVCGGANNILAEPEVEDILRQREILSVPDPVSSAGAVIEGVGRMILGLDSCDPLIDKIRATTRDVLVTARQSGRSPGEVARELAEERIRGAREEGPAPLFKM